LIIHYLNNLKSLNDHNHLNGAQSHSSDQGQSPDRKYKSLLLSSSMTALTTCDIVIRETSGKKILKMRSIKGRIKEAQVTATLPFYLVTSVSTIFSQSLLNKREFWLRLHKSAQLPRLTSRPP
jgi:hypothetical protein